MRVNRHILTLVRKKFSLEKFGCIIIETFGSPYHLHTKCNVVRLNENLRAVLILFVGYLGEKRRLTVFSMVEKYLINEKG